ncbi:phosphodiesterase, partial [Deltaproteobacteria bacterium OttesenSCG-928-K17]|nr:phosphodiesterase [Deltaproteobacteria bacterium OttesenSCG-928-K17]
IHGSLLQTEKIMAVGAETGADRLLLLGDILYHGPRNPLPAQYDPAGVVKILAEAPFPVIAVRGNCDAEVDELVLPFHLAESAWLLDGRAKIFAIHGHQLKINGGLLDAPNGGAVLSGHSHVPTAEIKGDIHFWNPGSTSLPKQNFPPSYGLYDQGRFSVITFEGETLMSDSLPR